MGRGVSTAGTPVAADAPPASDNDIPTAPNTGKASFRPFRFTTCFVCRIVESSISSSKLESHAFHRHLARPMLTVLATITCHFIHLPFISSNARLEESIGAKHNRATGALLRDI